MTTLAVDSGVGALLRSWREQRRISQLELALRADSSARHISFIETGRSRPSQEMLLRLAESISTYRCASATPCCSPPVTPRTTPRPR